MDRRKTFYLMITLSALMIISFIFIFDRVTIKAAEGVLIDQEWVATLSSPLLAGNSSSKHLFITNTNGEKVNAEIRVDETGKTIRVRGLEEGTYTLHVDKNSIKGKPFKRLATEQVSFNVLETLESVSSEKELARYFEQVKLLREDKQKMTVEIEESSAKDSAADESSIDVESEDFSETNAQVEGVDESDIVKTDGQYIYSIIGDARITVTDIRNPSELKIASVIQTEKEMFYPTQLFLHEDVFIVLGEEHMGHDVAGDVKEDRVSLSNSMTTIRLYDISKREKPHLIREIGTEGYLNGARKIGDFLYFVTNMHPNYWTKGSVNSANLRPLISDSNKDEKLELLAYEDISLLPGTLEPTYSVITAFDLATPSETKVETKGYLGGSEQLYMSKENLYLTATSYEPVSESDFSSVMRWNPTDSNTEVFKFDLKGAAITFDSNAKLEGMLLNQFSMDEYNGNFRAVTTSGNMWDDKNISKNNLFIFDEKMNQIGSVEGLAKGERIYSARFMGDKAYMVTFRETDPLFVIDVANPTAPKVLGELKIPGYSNYLHPLDENHLIGFGYETVAEKSEQGREPIITTLGMKISLFDVSDFHHPKEKYTEIIGGKGTYSQIQYDHKALFQHRARNLYGFPIEIYEAVKNSDNLNNVEYKNSGALVYEITPEHGIILKGDLLGKEIAGEQYSDYEKQIERMLYSKDELYTISMKNINSYSLDTFAPIDELQVNK